MSTTIPVFRSSFEVMAFATACVPLLVLKEGHRTLGGDRDLP